MKTINSIIINESDKSNLIRFLLKNPDQENMAVSFCGHSSFGNHFQLLVKNTQYIENDDLLEHSAISLLLKDEAYRKLLIESDRTKTSLLFWHSHPFSDIAWFSDVDNHNDMINAKFIIRHLPHAYFCNAVVAQKDLKILLYNKKKNEMEEVQTIQTFGHPKLNGEIFKTPELDRNYRAFGKQGQDVISNLKVALVGNSGLGWPIGLQLTALGVGELLNIDYDLLKITNMNRLPGAPFSKVGKPKVKVLAYILKKMNPKIKVTSEKASVLDPNILQKLKKYDIIIGAVDSEMVRAVLNKFAVQYLKYYIDAGSEIILEDGKVKHAGGQVNLVIPGVGPCLACHNTLDWKTILYESLNKEEQEFEVSRGYIRGVSEPSASVVSINGVVASTLVNQFLALATGLKKPAYYTFFDFMSDDSQMFTINEERNENCIICSKNALLAYGDITRREKYTDELPTFLKEGTYDE